MTKRRVVITGLGAVSPIGNDLNTILENLKAGYCGIDYIKSYDTSNQEVKIAAEVKNLNFEEYLNTKEIKRLDKVSIFAIIAAKKALKDSNLNTEYIKNNFKIGINISSGIGGLESIENNMFRGIEKGFDRVSPFFIPMAISNMPSANVSIHLGINGSTNCNVSACAGGTNAIGEAFRNIRDGYSDIIFAGGSEASITPLAIGGFTSIQALSKTNNINRASIPFDAERNGFVMGEGSAILILEELEHALNRNAKIYAEICGYGFTSDANHITAPNKDGFWAAQAITNAINDANINYSDIDYINAHATSTKLNDLCETNAIRKAFKEHANNIKISGTKSMTGHLLGAAGAIEALITSLSIKHNFIAPTINFEIPDEECNLNIVKNNYIESNINYAISNSLGFGGHNCAIILKKFNI